MITGHRNNRTRISRYQKLEARTRKALDSKPSACLMNEGAVAQLSTCLTPLLSPSDLSVETYPHLATTLA
jgi:hypothetical protein